MVILSEQSSANVQICNLLWQFDVYVHQCAAVSQVHSGDGDHFALKTSAKTPKMLELKISLENRSGITSLDLCHHPTARQDHRSHT